jgi:DNA transposition AAA+ family ATPase
MAIAALSINDDETVDIRAQIGAILAAKNAPSQAVVARESGVSASALNQWLNGRYAGDNSGVEIKLEQWVAAFHARRARERTLPSAPAWISMPSSERVLATLSYAQYGEDIVVIYGAAGVGKTQSCKHYLANNPNVWLATMSPASARTVPALEEVAEAVGLHESGGGAKLQRMIIRKIRGTYGLLIIDEAQHLALTALDELRTLHDATGIGLALVGNEAIYARMTGGNRAAYLDRLYSRVGKRLHLLRAQPTDVNALITAWGMRAKDCSEICHAIARKPGGLRGLTKTLRLASMFAAGAHRTLICTDIRAAWRDLGGES